MPNLLEQFTAKRSQNTQFIAGWPGAHYPIENSTLGDYLSEFHPFARRIRKALNESRKLGREIIVGDFASSSPSFLFHAHIPNVVGLSVGITKTQAGWEDIYKEHNLAHIQGDFLDGRTWSKIHEWTDANGAFDVLFFSPKAGMSDIIPSLPIGEVLLLNAMKYVAPDGALVAETPYDFDRLGRREKKLWIERMRAKGIDVTVRRSRGWWDLHDFFVGEPIIMAKKSPLQQEDKML